MAAFLLFYMAMRREISIKPTILVVDDDEDMLFLMQHKLTAEGFTPLICPNGKNVMSIIIDKHPDLVLLDLNMQGINGDSICNDIKSNQTMSDIPVVIFSANENICSVSDGCGADGYLKKPFNGEKFSQTFLQALAHNKLSH